MIIKDVQMLVTNTDMAELQDHTIYCRVGLLSMDDGQKFDVSVRDKGIYEILKPLTKVKFNLDVTNSKYGIKIGIKDVLEVGKAI